MTLGQRIAQKRKELGLSQEGLGERLGVSRQAIYKWESDASLPEIDKLITLSRIFSVSVGCLLGVEEDTSPQDSAPGELSEAQLAMVQEITDRYLATQPKPRKSAWDKWSVRILFAMCGIMLALLVGANSRIKTMEEQYTYMANSIGEVSYSVDSQINSITSRVERILKSQNTLTADWSAELASTDLAAETATFDIRVVPKTYVEGMTALFQARSGESTVELPVGPGEDHAFSGQITCPLTDDISLTVIFLTGDKRETQWLEDYDYLYTGSFPNLSLDSRLWSDMVHLKDNLLPASESPGTRVENYSEDGGRLPWGWEPEPPATIQVGLFRNQKLVTWYEGRMVEININGIPTTIPSWFRTQEVELEPGKYCEAAVYTDEYGRQMVYPGTPRIYPEEGSTNTSAAVYSGSSDPADWEF